MTVAIRPQTDFQEGPCRPHRKTRIDPFRPFKFAKANVGYRNVKRSSNSRDKLGS